MSRRTRQRRIHDDDAHALDALLAPPERVVDGVRYVRADLVARRVGDDTRRAADAARRSSDWWDVDDVG